MLLLRSFNLFKIFSKCPFVTKVYCILCIKLQQFIILSNYIYIYLITGYISRSYLFNLWKFFPELCVQKLSTYRNKFLAVYATVHDRCTAGVECYMSRGETRDIRSFETARHGQPGRSINSILDPQTRNGEEIKCDAKLKCISLAMISNICGRVCTLRMRYT